MSSKSPRKTSALFISLGMGMTVVAIVALVIGFFLLQLPEPLIDHRIMMVAAAVVMFLIGFVLSTMVARKYGKPIEDLNERATRFVQGDYNVDFRLQNGPSEVVDLGESLQAITTSTRTAIAELHAEEQRQAQFVSDVSHEIRTPLTGIRGYAETLMQDDVPDDMRMHFLESIIRECSRLTRLANDLLDLQRIDAEADRPNWKRLNLREIVEDVHDTLEPLLEDREVALTIGGEPIESSRAISTPAAVDEYGSVTSRKIVKIPWGCCPSLSVEYVSGAVDDPAAVPTPAIRVVGGSLTIGPVNE